LKLQGGDPSHSLYQFLGANNQSATHFMIGVNILGSPVDFLEAYNQGGDIAVHTWTHPFMSTLPNEMLVAQFGWTMQIIYDSTGGQIPKFWRPPYGDMDLRVRAIAKEVFSLSPIVWNEE
jgi:chitin deacetylase